MSDGEAAGSTGDDEAPDLDARRLCPDGACTGVLDDAGRCKECGRAEGAAPPEPEQARHAEPGEAESAEFADRTLCPDGACIGLIGDDGRCKACGRAAEAP
jgi:hypothetical protein